MKLPFNVIELLRRKSGSDLRLPSDCQLLSLDIEGRTGVHVGATTLKRLLGFVSDDRMPHQSTLDIIARYLGYAHWEELSKVEYQGNSDFGSIEDELRSADLQPGAVVTITYLPDRELIFSYLGDNRFCVVESHHSKLQKDDEVEIHHFVLRHPLFVLNVWRNGQPLGSFTAGRVSGLSSIMVK